MLPFTSPGNLPNLGIKPAFLASPALGWIFFFFNYYQFALIHGPNIPGFYAIFVFSELDFTSTTSPIHIFRNGMTNLESVLKSRDITWPTKVHRVKVMIFSVVKYGCESWAIKKAEHQIMDALELWCWRRLLSLLDCKGIKSVNHKGNQS